MHYFFYVWQNYHLWEEKCDVNYFHCPAFYHIIRKNGYFLKVPTRSSAFIDYLYDQLSAGFFAENPKSAPQNRQNVTSARITGLENLYKNA